MYTSPDSYIDLTVLLVIKVILSAFYVHTSKVLVITSLLTLILVASVSAMFAHTNIFSIESWDCFIALSMTLNIFSYLLNKFLLNQKRSYYCM